MVVSPTGNTLPLGSPMVCTTEATPQLSIANASGKLTTAPQIPASVPALTSIGHAITGSVSSRIKTKSFPSPPIYDTLPVIPPKATESPSARPANVPIIASAPSLSIKIMLSQLSSASPKLSINSRVAPETSTEPVIANWS